MAATHPYVNAPGPFLVLLSKLRTNFPSNLTVETLKKLGLAAGNETYIINTLRFVGVIDENGAKSPENTKFFLSDENAYQSGLKPLVKKAYADLFETHGENAWKLSRADLTTYFRMSDGTSEIVGARQASTFEALAAQAGMREHVEPVKTAPRSSSATTRPPRNNKAATATGTGQPAANATPAGVAGSGMAFSIRVELNLPTTDNQAVYDSIFKSLRENLIDPSRPQ